MILRRGTNADLTATVVSSGTTLKEKMYKRHARRGLAEAMLGPGVIVVEGITEHSVLSVTAEKLEVSNSNCYPLDLSGIAIFPVDGDGSLPDFGAFFKALGLKTFAFYDKKQRKPKENQKLIDSFDVLKETQYTGIEFLLASEVPVDRQWQFLEALRSSEEQGNLGIPISRPPNDEEIKNLMTKALKSNKGNGYAARLIDLCEIAELPSSITLFLHEIYKAFPKPESVPLPASQTVPIIEEKQPDDEQTLQLIDVSG